MKTTIRSAFAVLSIALLSFGLHAEPEGVPAPNTPATKEAVKPSKRDWYPFHGYIASVDSSSQSVGLQRKAGERLLKLAAGGEILRDGKLVPLAELKTGEYLRGKARKDESGAECIVSANASEDAPAPKASRSKVRKLQASN